MEIPDGLDGLVKYFKETYLTGIPARGRRRAKAPRYPPHLWNQHEATLQGLDRTNNVSEGWHNRFKVIVAKDHPSLYSLIIELQKEQGDTEVMITEVGLGRSVKAAPKRTWTALQDRLRKVTEGYEATAEELGISEFLRRIAYNIEL